MTTHIAATQSSSLDSTSQKSSNPNPLASIADSISLKTGSRGGQEVDGPGSRSGWRAPLLSPEEAASLFLELAMAMLKVCVGWRDDSPRTSTATSGRSYG